MDSNELLGDLEVLRLCDVIRQTGYDIHHYLGSGHLEKVYENALAHRLRKQGFIVAQQSLCKYATRMGHYLEAFSPIF